MLEADTVSRSRKGRAYGWKRRSVSETAADGACPVWSDVSGRRMFVVGYTPGGAPYGILEDEMDADTGSPDVGERCLPY
jgi:hypothetical protein